jgi:hypothetical protein
MQLLARQALSAVSTTRSRVPNLRVGLGCCNGFMNRLTGPSALQYADLSNLERDRFGFCIKIFISTYRDGIAI